MEGAPALRGPRRRTRPVTPAPGVVVPTALAQGPPSTLRLTPALCQLHPIAVVEVLMWLTTVEVHRERRGRVQRRRAIRATAG